MATHRVKFQSDIDDTTEIASEDNSKSISIPSSVTSLTNLPDSSPKASQETLTTNSSPPVTYENVAISSESSMEEIPIDDEKSDTNETDIKSTYVLPTNARTLEKEVREALRSPYVRQQLSWSMSVPGDFDLSSPISISRKRSIISKRIPFLQKFRKTNESETQHGRPFEIFKYADKLDYLLMFVGTIAALGFGACYPLMLLIYRKVLNSLLKQSNHNISNDCLMMVNHTETNLSTAALKNVINYYLILGFVVAILSWIAWSSWIITGERQVRRIRFALFRNILRQEIGWFDLSNAGELSNRLIDDLDRIKDGMSKKVPDFLLLLTWMIGALVYAFSRGWKLALIFLSISPLIIFTFNLTIKIIIKYTIKEVKAFACASAIVQEVLQNIRTVTAFHGQAKEEERFAHNLIKVKEIGIKKGIYVGLCQGLTNVFSYSATALTLWYGFHHTQNECLTSSAGTVLTVVFACMNVAKCASQLIPNIQVFVEAITSGSCVFDIIKRQSQIDGLSDEGERPKTIQGELEFKNVSFTYPARQDTPILNRLSFKIPPGKTVAFVGSSGCGKSTTFQLIQRFYDPTDGRILLDGRNLTTLNVSWLRSQLGIVSQEPVLFTGTIEENIRFGKPDATDEEVRIAAKMANAHDFIMTLPQNYKTPSGCKLSGGQKQRVAIARALISNPKILLLDEATSALDNTSERVVQEALDKAKEGRTTIVIAHRLSTIRNADIIIGFENGQVIEHGSHDELMKKKGLYYDLVTTQTQKDEHETESDSDDEDETEDCILARQMSVARTISKISAISSANSDGWDHHTDPVISKRNSNYLKYFYKPFLFEMFKYNISEWHWILLGIISSLLFGASQPLFGWFFAKFYSSMGEPNLNEQKRLIQFYTILCFLNGLGGGIAQFFISLSFAKSGEALTMYMRKLTLKAILRQEMNFFDMEANSVGALVTRLSSDAAALKGLTGLRIGSIFESIGALLLGLIIALTVSWKTTLITLAFAPLLILSGKLRSLNDNQSNGFDGEPSFIEQGGQYATQAIEQIRTVVTLKKEIYFVGLYENVFNQEFKKQIYQAPLIALGAAIPDSLLYFLQFACFSYGARLVENGELHFDKVYRVFCVMILIIFIVGRSLAMMPDYSKAKAAALRIINLHKRSSLIDPNDESGIILNEVKGDIEFHDVYFRYPTRMTMRILRHFSLKCLQGHTTALVGPSGSGKSTTVALLQRFYDPIKGQILLDGHNIKVLNIRWLRSLIGLVQQEPVLFNLSIRDNIAYGDNSRSVTQEDIEKVARMSNIHELILGLPQAYETICGSRGSQLSGGQKQRIAIARALIRNPKILLLDEATSALDNKSEKVVQEALDQARTGRTCITIAHRLSAIKTSEKIAVVNRGKVSEEGTHDELLKKGGAYAKLALIQKRTGKKH
ncbi:hypothetical protein I4U23_012783 [Adineta vaga]|nr:hypothetical protein I4U23_012783 [Adineta vaga]